MRHRTTVVLVAWVLSASCCTARNLQVVTTQLDTQTADLDAARRSGHPTAQIQQQLAQTAREAATDADSAANPKDKVAFYRVAAVAAWQAGPAGNSLVGPITSAGIAACEALPGKDTDAPRDCSLIRMAMPMAVQDEAALALAGLKTKPRKLPASNLPDEVTHFGDLEAQFGKVSVVRDGLHNLDVPPTFVAKTDAQRLIIYCNAVVAWSLMADTEGGSTTFTQTASRKAAMADRLQQSGVVVNCDAVMSNQTTPPSP